MTSAGTLARLKDATVALLKDRFAVRQHDVLDARGTPPSVQRIWELFGPDQAGAHRPRRRGTLALFFKFFNGNWLEKKIVVHTCKNGCCDSYESALEKGTWILRKFISTVTPRMFSKDNWAGWHDSLFFLAYATSFHELIADALPLAFREDQLDDVMPADDLSELLATLGAGSAPQEAGEGVGAQMLRDHAQTAKIMLDFVTQPASVMKQTVLMSATLRPQRALMQFLLESVSGRWEERELHDVLSFDRRRFRVCMLASGPVLPDFYKSTWEMAHTSLVLGGLPRDGRV